jgi:hypothetical protein
MTASWFHAADLWIRRPWTVAIRQSTCPQKVPGNLNDGVCVGSVSEEEAPAAAPHLMEIAAMRRFIFLSAVCLAVSACTQQPDNATIASAAAGAAIGAKAAASTVVGQPGPNQCIYRRSDGTRFFGPCA